MTFEELYNQSYEPIYRFAFRMTGHSAAAEDITQETFLRMYKEMSSENCIKNHRAWLYRVAGNLCKNMLRRRQTLRKIIDSGNGTHERTYQPEENCIKNSDIAIFRKALEKIPLKDRMLLQLYQDGLSYAEIAEAAEINKNSVGKMLSRAIEKAAVLLQEGIKV